MAVSPSDIMRNVEMEADKYEKLIDEMLLKKKIIPGNDVYLDYPKGMDNAIWNVLKKRYLEAGWSDIKYESYRNETHLIFKTKNKDRLF